MSPTASPRSSRSTKLPQVTICGVGDLARCKRRNFTHIISIWEAESKPRIKELRARMESQFPGVPIHFAFFDDVEMSAEDAVPPCQRALHEILEFAASAGDDADLLIHCFAGVSRSTAVAYGVLCQALGNGHERAVFELLRRIRPQLAPNRLITSIADALLQREGRMARIAEDHWRTMSRNLVPFPAEDEESDLELAAG